MAKFELDSRLMADTAHVCDGPLSEIRLMDDCRYPWLVVIPKRAGITEMQDLELDDLASLGSEIMASSRTLTALFGPDKINVGALGNLVPQLHVHVIARRRDDPAWPGPVWGHSAPVPYAAAEREALIGRLSPALHGRLA